MGFTIGCVEDHEPDLILIQHALRSVQVGADSFLHANDLQGLKSLAQSHELDVVVLDLGLPDSHGLETVGRAREAVAAVPIVVLTGQEESGTAAIAAGADDFLNKEVIGNGQLARVVSYAVERRRLRERVDEAEQRNELNRLEKGSGARSSVVAGRMLGETSLTESDPDFFTDATSCFVDAVRGRLVQNAMGESKIGDETMRMLGERLASRDAGPDDIVRVLTSAVHRQRLQLSPSQFGPFVREARLALIELMGYVLAHYRRHAHVGQMRRERAGAAYRAAEEDSRSGEGVVLIDESVEVRTSVTDTKSGERPPEVVR